MKVTRRQLRQIINEELLSEIGPGVFGMDPTGATMPRGMKRSEYKQLEGADPENTRMVLSILDPSGALSIPDIPPAIEAFKKNKSAWTGVMLVLSALAVIPLAGVGFKLGKKGLTATHGALKLAKAHVPPNFAGKIDELLALVSGAHKDLVSDINKIKGDLFDAQMVATGKPGFAPNIPPPLESDALKKAGYEDLLKVGAKASKSIPDIAYPVFAKKLLVSIGSKLSKLKTTDTRVLFKDYVYYVDNVPPPPPGVSRGGGPPPPPSLGHGRPGEFMGTDGLSSSNGFSYDKIIKWWDEIPGNPDGLGFKDMTPDHIGFELKNILSKSEISALAEEMFEQFPAMKKVFKDSKHFAKDISGLTLKVGANAEAGGTASGNLISITPYSSAEAFTKAWRNSKNVKLFIEDMLAGSKGTWAHEFDHWLRKLSQSRAGVNIKKAWNVDYHLPDGSINSKKWASKFFEFEAEFTSAQMKLLDDLLRNGMTDELAKVLKNRKAFETHFLQQLPARHWQGSVGKEALKRVRKRLFDTERGLYHVLRRELGIAGDAKKPLPESLIRALVRKMIYEKSPVRGYHPDESYEEGTIKNLMLDKETSHGGWPEGPSKSFTSDDPVNKQIADWLKSMKMVKS